MAYAYRAFHAIPLLSNRNGIPTNAVLGFVQMVQRMFAHAVPDGAAVAFDTPEPTFRHERLATYKAQRPPMPPALAEQLPWIKEYLRALRIPCLEYPRYEADDVIATLARRAEAQGTRTLIASSDKDLCQLVGAQIGILCLGAGEPEVLDAAGVVRKFGVRPGQMVDYLTLVGDSSDNVPGVQGIGPKTAAELLQRYETLEEIYAHVDELKPRFRARLTETKATVLGMRELLRVDCSAPVKESVNDLKLQEPEPERLEALRQFLGFSGGRQTAPAPPAASGEQMTMF